MLPLPFDVNSAAMNVVSIGHEDLGRGMFKSHGHARLTPTCARLDSLKFASFAS